MIDGFSIVIPVYRDVLGLEKTTQSIQKSLESVSTAYEIIVCNDGADSKVSNFCLKDNLREIELAERKGSYYARNRGIEAAKYQYFLFADADISVVPSWFQYIDKSFGTHEYIAFKISMSVNSNMSLFKKYSVVKEFQTDGYFKNNHFGPTAFLWVSRETLEKVGLFDESLYSGGDLEFGKRVHSAGIIQHYVKKKYVFHPPRSFAASFSKRIRVLNGLKELEKRQVIQLHDSFSFYTLVLLPFRSAYRFFKTLQKRREIDFGISSIIYAETLHSLINFFAFALVLFGFGKEHQKRKSEIPYLNSTK